MSPSKPAIDAHLKKVKSLLFSIRTEVEMICNARPREFAADVLLENIVNCESLLETIRRKEQ